MESEILLQSGEDGVIDVWIFYKNLNFFCTKLHIGSEKLQSFFVASQHCRGRPVDNVDIVRYKIQIQKMLTPFQLGGRITPIYNLNTCLQVQ